MEVKTVLLRGNLYFRQDSTFKGPIRKGLRPALWYSRPNGKATSCSIISNVEINAGETKCVDIVLLNELQLGVPVTPGIILKMGSTTEQIGEFTVIENMGVWQGGKVS